MNYQLQAIVTLLALINPLVCATMFMQIEAGQAKSVQIRTALQSAVAVGVILSLAALLGTKLLHAFGISLDAFSVAGGGVLAWIGFSMISRQPRRDYRSDHPCGSPLTTCRSGHRIDRRGRGHRRGGLSSSSPSCWNLARRAAAASWDSSLSPWASSSHSPACAPSLQSPLDSSRVLEPEFQAPSINIDSKEATLLDHPTARRAPFRSVQGGTGRKADPPPRAFASLKNLMLLL